MARGYSSDDEKERAWHCMCTTPIGVENVLPAITTDLGGVGEARAAVPLEEHDRRLASEVGSVAAAGFQYATLRSRH